MAAHELRFAQQLLVYHCAGFELIKIIKIHDRILLVKGGVVKSALWQSPNQRHLPAFEPDPNAPAGARFLSLMTFAARHSVPCTLTTIKSYDPMTRFGTWTYNMQTIYDWTHLG